MERKLKEIVVDKSSLSWLRSVDGLYVDKTGYLLKLISSGSYFFLSRPRRFGKSLTVDTLEQIFKGNKELFKGLYIYDKYDFKEYPILHFNMNNLRSNSYENNIRLLLSDIREKAHAMDVDLDESIGEPFYYFSQLLRKVSSKEGRPVAVLVDEYDYPLLQAVYDDDRFEKTKEMLASFYETLKIEESSVKFCFITGITRFPHVSIFSKLNNLIDISSSPEYAALCGYTDEELDSYFAPYMENYFEKNNITGAEDKKAFRQSIKEYYDGYRFSIRSDQSMYNPVSIGRFFNGGCVFDNFWIETGAQELVNDVIEKNNEIFRGSDEFPVPISKTAKFEVRKIFTEHPDRDYVLSYLLQAGYLTIRGEEAGDYVLSYPNQEVKDAMDAAVLSSYGLDLESNRVAALRRGFREENTADVIKVLYKSFTRYPYHLTLDREKGFQIAVFSMLRMCLDANAEEATNIGRIDIRVKVKEGLYYIIELKLDESADAALKQIREKRYYEKYEKEGNVIHLLGINFSSAERNITDWKEEIIRL